VVIADDGDIIGDRQGVLRRGHWSSYPANKHDRDAMTHESPTRARAISNDPDHEWMLR
jgi:5-deoxy-D-glucuronate isomerase